MAIQYNVASSQWLIWLKILFFHQLFNSQLPYMSKQQNIMESKWYS